MTASSETLKQQTLHSVAWIVVFPFLAVWPFLSALPVFSLFGASAFDLTSSLNLVFLLTGFWAFVAAFVVVWSILADGARAKARIALSGTGLLLGSYASVWTSLYVIAMMANR